MLNILNKAIALLILELSAEKYLNVSKFASQTMIANRIALSQQIFPSNHEQCMKHTTVKSIVDT